MKLSIVIPACNEEKRGRPTLEEYINHFSNKYELELVVVLNGCTDGTKDLVENFAKERDGIRFMSFPKRLGKGGAIIQGFKFATGDIIGFTDADNSVKAKEFEKLIIALDEYDGAIASRWLPDSKTIVKETKIRKFARWTFRLLTRIFFNITFKDSQCGGKVFKGHVVREITPLLSTTNSSFDIELLYRAKKRGYRIKEVPVTWSITWTHDLDSDPLSFLCFSL